MAKRPTQPLFTKKKMRTLHNWDDEVRRLDASRQKLPVVERPQRKAKMSLKSTQLFREIQECVLEQRARGVKQSTVTINLFALENCTMKQFLEALLKTVSGENSTKITTWDADREPAKSELLKNGDEE